MTSRSRRTLSDGVAARDLQNVVLVAEQNAAGALARTVGRALGYDTTAVMVMTTGDRDVVGRRQRRRVDCGSANVHPRRCGRDGHPAGYGGSLGSHETPSPAAYLWWVRRSAVCSVKSSLERLIPQPVIVPEEPEFALARGAALAAANVPGADESTCGLAYSQDPDELAALDHVPVKLADADTQAALFDSIASDVSWARRTTERTPGCESPSGTSRLRRS